MSNYRSDKIEIYGQQYQTADGRKFTRYTAKSKQGQWYNVKFAQKSGLSPVFQGWGEVIGVDYFVKPGGEYLAKDGSKKVGNPIIWIMSAEKVYPVEKPAITEDELPF